MEYFQTYYWHRIEKRWKIGRKLDSAFVQSERKRESTSLDITSSFFWSSPCIFAAPCKPVRLEIPALCTRDAICLQASEMLDNTMVNSASMIPFCSCCKSQPVKVSISYWLLLCLGAGGSTLTAALATPAALPDCLLQLYSCPLAFKPTIEPRKQDPVQKSGCKYEVPPPPLLLGMELSLLLHPELLELTTVGDAANAAAVVDAMISPCHTTRARAHTLQIHTHNNTISSPRTRGTHSYLRVSPRVCNSCKGSRFWICLSTRTNALEIARIGTKILDILVSSLWPWCFLTSVRLTIHLAIHRWINSTLHSLVSLWCLFNRVCI